MAHRQRRRGWQMAIMLMVAAVGVGCVLYALRGNIHLYVTPHELSHDQHRVVRLGGLVVQGSFKRTRPLDVHFRVTDFQAEVPVRYHGLLPALFREGQGVVMLGALNQEGIFVARQILAKHDENYHPPDVPRKRPA